MDAKELERVRSIVEKPDHFEVDHETRGTFRIAKSVLPADIAESIRSVAKGKAAAAEALANQPGGDGVTRAATGAIVDDPARVPQAPGPLDVLGNALGAVKDAVLGPPLKLDKGEPTPSHFDTAPYDDPHGGRLYPSPTEDTLGRPSPIYEPPPPGTVNPLDATKSLVDAMNADAGKDVAAYKAQLPEIRAPAIPGQVPPAMGAGGSAGVPAVPSAAVAPFDSQQLDAAAAMQRQAIEEHGRIASQLALEHKRVQDQTNAALGELATTYNGRIEENHRRLQSMADELATKPITRKDPGWAATIGVALGAFGSALTGTPNFALQIVNKRIDDDLERQKEERANKKSLIGFYRDQGLSLENAYKMARADKLAEAAGAMQSAALQAGSTQAIATAKEASGKLMADAFRLTQEAHISDYKAKTAPIALQSELRSAAIQQQIGVAQKRLLDLQTAQAPARAAAENAKNKLELQELQARTQKNVAEAEKAKREGGVNFPKFAMGESGEPVLLGMERRRLVDARDQDTSKEVVKSVAALDALRRARQFFAPGFRAGPTSNQEWQTLANELLGLVKRPGDNSDSDVERLRQALPSDSTWSQLTDKNLAAIRGLEQRVLSNLDSLKQTSVE